jgi:hypothetical protein
MAAKTNAAAKPSAQTSAPKFRRHPRGTSTAASSEIPPAARSETGAEIASQSTCGVAIRGASP